MKRRRDSDVCGVVVIDKPRGPTSFDVVAEVRRRMHTARVGHTGTLDPMATGILPICLGEACKLVPFLTDCDKAYEADVVFGIGTTTGDAEGDVVARTSVDGLTAERVALQAEKLVGEIMQTPPMYSAIKIDGQRLYDLARQGIEVERKARPVTVRSLSVMPVEGDGGAVYRLRITCTKGTYIRVIAEDLGALLGVPAHLSMLRRTAVGRFDLAQAVQLRDLSSDTPLVGLADAVDHLPTTIVDEEGARRIRAGQERWLFALATPPHEGRSRIVDQQNCLVAVIARAGQKIVFERVFVDSSGALGANTGNLQPL
ncbi:MAG: tRNA pseudouridine(55) synthase TruB [Polyangia bacterium]